MFCVDVLIKKYICTYIWGDGLSRNEENDVTIKCLLQKLGNHYVKEEINISL